MKVKDRYFSITRTVTLINALLNLILALSKILVGWIGHSQVLVADGIHSFADLISDTMIYVAARLGHQSPDKDHPYGHRRIETLGATIMALLLVFTGIYISYHAIVSTPNSGALPSVSVIWVALISILVNEGLYRYSLYFGKKINSQLLIANAWHNRSDALVSCLALVTVSLDFLGVRRLDKVGALVIGLWIIYAGSKMIYSCFSELIDTGVDEKTLSAIQKTIKTVDGVMALHQLRTRSLGGEQYVDVHILVGPKISVSEGHYIGEQVRLALLNHIEHCSDVTVHVDSEDDENTYPCVHLPNRSMIERKLTQACCHLPEWKKLDHWVVHYCNGQIDLELYFSCPLEPQAKVHYLSALQKPLGAIHQINFYHQL